MTDLWDTQNAGHLSFRQLADGIARCTELVESVSLKDVVNFNADPSHRIDRTEFGHLLETLVERAGVYCPIFVLKVCLCEHFASLTC